MLTRFVYAALLAWPAVSAGAPPLTLNDAVGAALRNQPLLDAQQATLDAAAQSVVAEGQLPDPRLKLGNINDGPGNFGLTRDFGERSVAIEQSFPRAEKRQLRSDRARLEGETARVELDNLRRSIARDAKLAWLNAYYPLRAATLMRDNLRYVERQREVLEIAFRAGKVRLTEVSRLQVEMSLQQDRVAELQGQAAKARAELARWVGPASERDLSEVLSELPPPIPLSELLARIEHHPTNAAMLNEISLAGNDVALARAALRPDWSLEVAYHKRGAAFTDFVSVQVGIDLPIFSTNRQDRSIAAKEALHAKAESLHADHLRKLAAEIQALYAEWQSNRQRLDAFDSEVLPQAARRVDAAVASYAGGQGDLPGVLEAKRAEMDARLMRLGLAVAALKIEAQLAYFAA